MFKCCQHFGNKTRSFILDAKDNDKSGESETKEAENTEAEAEQEKGELEEDGEANESESEEPSTIQLAWEVFEVKIF